MRTMVSLGIIAALTLSMAACRGEENISADTEKKAELTVFAAASMTETLTEIAELYQEEVSDVTLVFNFDSSGTLQTQIEEGAVCDLFVSAGQSQMDALEEGGYIDESSRVDLLENRETL